MNEKDIAENNLIFKGYAGSIAYGTNHQDSDMDVRGITIFPKEYYYGLLRFDQYENKEEDIVIYNIKKFFELAVGCNPNIIELLFLPENCVLYTTDYWKMILVNKGLFLSKKVYYTCCGYSFAQLQKLKRPEINITGKRLELIQKYGYDVKFAEHCIRLLYEGIELLNDCNLILPGFYNKQLLDIRRGVFKLEEVFKEAERLQKLIDEAYIKTKLPYTWDRDEVSDLLVKVIEEYWYNNWETFPIEKVSIVEEKGRILDNKDPKILEKIKMEEVD